MTIRPFCALRPKPLHAEAVAALPYDVMNTEEARLMAADNPYSFLHVDKAEIDLPADTDPYSPVVYAKAKENLQSLADNGVFMQDEKPQLYIYQLEANGGVQTGLAACVSVAEYEQGIIKRHEFTRPDKEKDRIEHILACCAHTGPIFMAYRDPSGLKSPKTLMAKWMSSHSPSYDFTADDGVRHTLWVIDDETVAQELIQAFEAVPYIYIADGHHRNEAARKAALIKSAKSANPSNSAEGPLKIGESGNPDESQFYLAVIFPHDELTIMDYNRVVTDLNGMDVSSFMLALKEVCKVEESPVPVKPDCKHVVGMYIKGQWYRLSFQSQKNADVIDSLDVSVLQNKILSPVLGIKDPKTDKRIDFVGGIRGLSELEKRVDSGEMAVAFSMYPTSMDELMDVADANQIMPPKSTWFEPKLRSGLLVHVF